MKKRIFCDFDLEWMYPKAVPEFDFSEKTTRLVIDGAFKEIQSGESSGIMDSFCRSICNNGFLQYEYLKGTEGMTKLFRLYLGLNKKKVIDSIGSIVCDLSKSEFIDICAQCSGIDIHEYKHESIEGCYNDAISSLCNLKPLVFDCTIHNVSVEHKDLEKMFGKKYAYVLEEGKCNLVKNYDVKGGTPPIFIDKYTDSNIKEPIPVLFSDMELDMVKVVYVDDFDTLSVYFKVVLLFEMLRFCSVLMGDEEQGKFFRGYRTDICMQMIRDKRCARLNYSVK